MEKFKDISISELREEIKKREAALKEKKQEEAANNPMYIGLKKVYPDAFENNNEQTPMCLTLETMKKLDSEVLFAMSGEGLIEFTHGKELIDILEDIHSKGLTADIHCYASIRKTWEGNHLIGIEDMQLCFSFETLTAEQMGYISSFQANRTLCYLNKGSLYLTDTFDY